MQNSSLCNASAVQPDQRSKVISALLPWVQWLHVYAFISGVTLGYVVIVLLDIAIVVREILLKKSAVRIRKKSDKYIVFLFLYVFVALLIIMASGYPLMPTAILNRLLKMICVFFLILHCGVGQIDWRVYKKSLRILTYYACIVLLAQFIMRFFTGRYYGFDIPFLRFANEETAERLAGESTGTRFRSIFSEPSHFVYFVFQYLCISLFDCKETKSKDILEALFVSSCVLLSGSSTGFVLLAVVWLLFLFSMWRDGKISKGKLGLSIFLLLLLVGLMIYVMNNEQLSFAIYRMTGSYERSDVVWKRVYSNMDDVGQMPGIFRFIGYGVGNVKSEFMNSIVYSFLNFGYIGVALIAVWLFNIFLSTDWCGKVTLLVFVLLMAIDMVLFTPTLLGYMIIVRRHFKVPFVSPSGGELQSKCAVTDNLQQKTKQV